MKRLITSAVILLILSGCATNKPAPKSNPNLPIVKNFKAYPDRNAIALFWSPIPKMSGYYIQRFDYKKKKWVEIAQINDPYKSIYVDTKLKPNHIYKYRIATFNKKGVPSLAKEISQKTLPTIQPVIPLEAKQIAKGTVKIIFRPHLNERVNEYIIEKFNDENTKWEELTTLKPRLNVEYIDKNLEDGKIYKYRIIAKTFDGLKSNPSKIITISTQPRPPIVSNIIASKNLPRKIVLTFSPVKNAATYNIYISSEPNGFFKFYKQIKKTKFIDFINEDGSIRYYKVTAVSKYNTESLLDKTPSVMGETLPLPAKPLVSTNRINNKIEFIFTSPDNRAKKYLIIKKEKLSLFKYKTQKFVSKTNKFIDTINPKKHYIYEIYEVDEYGLISKNPTVIEVE